MSYTFWDYPPRGADYPRAADPPVWPGNPQPARTSGMTPLPNSFEQSGVDPVSKLAAAIEKLAAALKGKCDGELTK